MKPSDFIRPENILLDLAVSTKSDVLQAIARHLASAQAGVSEGAVFEALQYREGLGSTGIGDGVAVPHAPIAGLTEPFGIVARLARPVHFDAIDEQPVDVVFALLTPAQSGKAHLNALACVARRLRAPDVLKQIRAAKTASQLYEVLKTDP
jgi:PTS system nitrogen regulatory IIA component